MHGQPRSADTELLDPATALGLITTIEDWLDLNPCNCEARCECDVPKWTGLRQDREIREWSSNPEADEAFARWIAAGAELNR